MRKSRNGRSTPGLSVIGGTLAGPAFQLDWKTDITPGRCPEIPVGQIEDIRLGESVGSPIWLGQGTWTTGEFVAFVACNVIPALFR